MKTTAIIVAAGSGSRFNSETPKQFVDLAGKPVIVRCLDTFEATSYIDEIIIVASKNHLKTVNGIGLDYHISKISKVIIGGETRSESVRNGVNQVNSHTEVIVIHDAARPFVHVNEIEAVGRAASEAGAACLVSEMTDTIKEVSGGRIVSTLDRSRLRRALTPQAFKSAILREAFAQYFDAQATDESSIVEKLGVSVACVQGNSRNIKITSQEDIVVAKALLSTYSLQGLTGCLE
jgi:2-C-methyl-D-erythritol 4-phosphate cytidylyltransferase